MPLRRRSRLGYAAAAGLRRRSRLGASQSLLGPCQGSRPCLARATNSNSRYQCCFIRGVLTIVAAIRYDKRTYPMRSRAVHTASSSHSGQREGEARPPRLGPVPSRHQPRLRTSPEADSDRTRIHRPSRDTAPRAQDRHQGQEHVLEAVTCVGPAGPAPIR